MSIKSAFLLLGQWVNVGIYDDILFLFNLEFFLYDHDQIFKTRINLDILDGFDTIQQQEQDIVLG